MEIIHKTVISYLPYLLSPNADDVLTYTGSAIEWKTGNYHPLASTAGAYGHTPMIEVNSIYGDGTSNFHHFTASVADVIQHNSSSFGGMPDYQVFAGNLDLRAHGDQGNYHGYILLRANNGTINLSAHNGEVNILVQ